MPIVGLLIPPDLVELAVAQPRIQLITILPNTVGISVTTARTMFLKPFMLAEFLWIALGGVTEAAPHLRGVMSLRLRITWSIQGDIGK